MNYFYDELSDKEEDILCCMWGYIIGDEVALSYDMGPDGCVCEECAGDNNENK